MDRGAEILTKKLEAKGIVAGEKLVMDVFEAIQETCTEMVLDPAVSALERGLGTVAVPVLAGLKPAIEKLADFNKDGKIG